MFHVFPEELCWGPVKMAGSDSPSSLCLRRRHGSNNAMRKTRNRGAMMEIATIAGMPKNDVIDSGLPGTAEGSLLFSRVGAVVLAECGGHPYSAMQDFWLITSEGKSERSMVCQTAMIGGCHAWTGSTGTYRSCVDTAGAIRTVVVVGTIEQHDRESQTKPLLSDIMC